MRAVGKRPGLGQCGRRGTDIEKRRRAKRNVASKIVGTDDVDKKDERSEVQFQMASRG